MHGGWLYFPLAVYLDDEHVSPLFESGLFSGHVTPPTNGSCKGESGRQPKCRVRHEVEDSSGSSMPAAG